MGFNSTGTDITKGMFLSLSANVTILVIVAAANARLEYLAKHAAEIALRLAALPVNGLHSDGVAINAVEYLALQVLKEVAAIRAEKRLPDGEQRGEWPSTPDTGARH